MFGISVGEVLVVLLISFLIFDIKEIVQFIHKIKDFFTKIQEFYNEFVNYLKIQIEDDFVDVILDEEGNSQKVYDVKKVKGIIKKSNKSDENNFK